MQDLGCFSCFSALMCVCIGVLASGLAYFVSKYYEPKESGLSRPTLRHCVEWILSRLPFVRNYFGGWSQQKLLFVPDADNQPNVNHEISEPALFRFLLNEETLEKLKGAEAEIPDMLAVLKDIDKESKITEFETHQSSMGSATDLKQAFHVFIVFKTTSETDDGDYWWSLEKNQDYIVLQRSSNKENVKDKLEGESRTKVKRIQEGLKGKGTIKDLFALLWTYQIIEEKYHLIKSNCQSLVTFVSKQITEIGFEYQGYFPYAAPPESGRDKKMLDLINILRGYSELPPLFTLILTGNIDLFDKIVASGKYDIDASYNGRTPLHFAIFLEETKMVQHLLKPPCSADPKTRGDRGKDALQMAAMRTKKTEIFDVLLAHPKVNVDDVDEDGGTALYLAACVSNVVAVQKLIDKGANPNISDKKGLSPLHVAATQRDDYEIIDVLLAHDKVKVDDVDENGQTALYWAASLSNPIAVKKLLANGANPNIVDKNGSSPLHVAAMQRDGNPVIDLLLEAQKVKGMGDVNGRNERGETALHWAAFTSNEITAEHLIEKGEDLHCQADNGGTPLHFAAGFATDMNIIDWLLRNIRDEEIDEYKEDETLLAWACNNEHGLGGEIIERLVAKGIFSNEQVQNPQVLDALNAVKHKVAQDRRTSSKSSNDHGLGGTMANRMEEAGTVRDKQPNRHKQFKAEVGGIAHIVVDNAVTMEDKVDRVLQMALANTIVDSDVKKVTRLVKEFGAHFSKVKWERGWNALHMASANAKTTEILDVILATGKFDINGVDKNGTTPLHYATIGNNPRINARHLLEKGADPTIPDNRGLTPFHTAALFIREPDILDLCLANNTFDIDHPNPSGMTALDLAITACNLTAARFLLSKGANPNVADKNGHTPLHVAAYYANEMNIVELLLNHKDVNVNYLDNSGHSALDCAKMNKYGLGEAIANLLREKMAAKAEGNNHEPENIVASEPSGNEEDSDMKTIRLLIEKEQDISALTGGEDGVNALHLASFYAKTTDLIDFILETGKIDINGVDSDGWTPLHHAIAGSNAAINARHLLEKGADPTIANNESFTPFHIAVASSQETDILDLFLANKEFDIDHRNHSGMTALHMAILQSNTVATEFLLSKGANSNVTDKDGFTPLHVATYYANDMEIVELLVNHKDVNVNFSENSEHSTLRYAKHNQHGLGEEIANLLREKMAAKAEGSVSTNKDGLLSIVLGTTNTD